MVAIVTRAVALTVLTAGSAGAVCCPIPPLGNWLEASGQTNLVVMDRDAGRVTVIANVGVAGVGRTFSLIVPTPAKPTLEEASAAIWSEAQSLTQFGVSQRGGDSSPFGCAEQVAVPETTDPQGEITIFGEETVGAFNATILTATSATALVDWLNENAFEYTPEDSAAFAPFIARGWYFTAMLLDSTAAELPEAQPWNVGLDPVAISYETETFEVPLPIMGINRSPRFVVTFLVVDERRMTLPGFRTRYANRISARELAAIREEAPTLSEYLATGTFFVRLERIFRLGDDMSESLELVPSGSTEEVHPAFARTSAIGSGPVLLLVSALSARLVARRRKGRPQA